MDPKVEETYRLLQYFSVSDAEDGDHAECAVAELIPEGTGHPWVDDAKSLSPRHVICEGTNKHVVVVEYQKP